MWGCGVVLDWGKDGCGGKYKYSDDKCVKRDSKQSGNPNCHHHY